MEAPQPLSYPINDFFNWYQRSELVLQPKFQRRPVWSDKARSYFVDTILRRMPVPKLFMRQQIDLAGHRTVREIVDGQQRLRAVIDYIEGKFVISKVHNQDFGNLYFYELPEKVKNDFLSYQLSVDLLPGATDTEVLDVFSRINSYTITLNAQEKLNAKYFGPLKQTAYELGYQHYKFWLNNRILTDLNIARMAEAELVSELIVAMLAGLQTGKAYLEKYYRNYDEQFPEAERIKKEFQATIDQIASVFGDRLPKTNFMRVPLFYSLFCVFYDALFGLPGSDRQRIKFAGKTPTRILEALLELDTQIKKVPPSEAYIPFIEASTRGTASLISRQTRYRFIWDAIASAIK